MTAILSYSYNTKFNIPKPPFPYATGTRLEVRSHTPPPPPSSYQSCDLEFEARQERRSVDPVERCLLHPPSGGTFTAGTAELEIVDFVRAGDQHSAQLFTDRVLSSSSITQKLPSGADSDELLVAKLYDPLYFDHEQDDADPFMCVDLAYRRETAAYTKLQSFQGGVIPRFFGSFSLSVPAHYRGLNDVRQVRLILMEYISGPCLADLDPSGFSQLERQTIMKAIVDTETALYNCDVVSNDTHPRNIMIPNRCPSSHESQLRPIVLVDLGKAWTSRSPFPKWHDRFLPGVPITPLLRWMRKPTAYNDWVDWDWRSWVEKHYGHEKNTITTEMEKLWGPRK